MVKRLLAVKAVAAVLLTVALLLPVAASADGITGFSDGKSILIDAQDKNLMILNGYDENGKLKASKMFTAENGEFEIPAELAQYRLRAGFTDDSGFYDVEIEEKTAETAAPEPAETPEATAGPTEAPVRTAAPASEPASSSSYPDIYERGVDAVSAFAVVKSVSLSINTDGEECYSLEVLYQGQECIVDIDKSVEISSASDEFSYMKDADAGALLEGDVIYFAANLSGKINKLSFIYRPVKSNIVTNGNDYGNNFSRLISDNGSVAGQSGWSVLKYGASNGNARYQFAFGVIEDKNSGSIVLLGADGDKNNALYLSIAQNTIVYVCDMSDKQKVSVGTAASLVKSSIPKSAADSDGRVTYSDSYRTNYAFVRLVNDMATDIVIYTNYNK